MDPASIVGLVASVAQLAQLALGVFSNLNTFYRKARRAPERSRKLRDGLDSLRDLLEDVHHALKNGPPTRTLQSPPKEFHDMIQLLQGLRDRTAQKETQGFIRRLQWPFREDENEEIIQHIEHLK